MFRLRVLGGFALDDGSGGPAPALPKRRADAVLAVLAVCGDLGCSRERVLALLWPESDEAGARHGLRDALHAIRRALGPGAVPAGRLLRLDPAVVASDAAAFDEAFAAGRYADAVTFYGGPLLDGFHVDDAAEFEQWLDGERARLARDYGEALKHLATDAEADLVQVIRTAYLNKPIVCNEDAKTGATAAAAASSSVGAGASYGLTLERQNQDYPFDFEGRADDPVAYDRIVALTR